MNFGECDELRSSFSPAVSRNITGCCISNIGETPKKQSFLRRGVADTSPIFCCAKHRGGGLIQSQRQLHFSLFYMLRKGVNISINHAHFLIGQHSQFIGDTHNKSPHKETDDTGN